MRERIVGALSGRKSSDDDHVGILVDIGRALRIASEEPLLDDMDLRDRLIAAGVEGRRAWHIVTFVPMAFGRPVLESFQVEVPETYLIRDDRGRDKRRRLRDQPVFRAAIDHLSDFSERPGFRELASRGAEINALSNLMHAGSKPENAVLTESVTWEPPD
jgi:hypothetical protein